jgi:hypothetical protein
VGCAGCRVGDLRVREEGFGNGAWGLRLRAEGVWFGVWGGGGGLRILGLGCKGEGAGFTRSSLSNKM